MNKWDWRGLSWNPNLTMEFVLEQPEFMDRFHWRGLSCNPNLTMEFILGHPELMDKWDWGELSKDQFQKHPHYNHSLHHKQKYSKVMDELIWKPKIGIKFYEPLLFEFGDTYEMENVLRVKMRND
jgi:hypothetical protein